MEVKRTMYQRKGPFTLAILAAIFAAISSGDFVACKLLSISLRFESPVVYTGDLKSPGNRA